MGAKPPLFPCAPLNGGWTQFRRTRSEGLSVVHDLFPAMRSHQEFQYPLNTEEKNKLTIADVLKHRVSKQYQEIVGPGVAPVGHFLEEYSPHRQKTAVSKAQ